MRANRTLFLVEATNIQTIPTGKNVARALTGSGTMRRDIHGGDVDATRLPQGLADIRATSRVLDWHLNDDELGNLVEALEALQVERGLDAAELASNRSSL